MADTARERQRIAAVIADSLDRHRTTGRSWSEWLAAADAVLAHIAEQDGFVLYENTPEGWTTTFHDPLERAEPPDQKGTSDDMAHR